MRWNKRKTNGRWPAGIPKPCVPTIGTAVPAGPEWLHEIKHDGYRLLVRKEGDAVSIITRGGYDWTERYPLIAAGARAIRAHLLSTGKG
jgi:bifunctional non-homologous end joining protein LigD